MDAGRVDELALRWREAAPDRDQRDRYVAACRALGLPDDASMIEYGRAWNDTIVDVAVLARCEVEYQRLQAQRPGRDVPDDAVSGWLLQCRAGELFHSPEWWMVERLRRQHLDRVATGVVPRVPLLIVDTKTG